MCVAQTGTVLRVDRKDHTAQVDFDGTVATARTGLLSVTEGDPVLVHAGCILQKLSESEAEELKDLMAEMAEL